MKRQIDVGSSVAAYPGDNHAGEDQRLVQTLWFREAEGGSSTYDPEGRPVLEKGGDWNKVVALSGGMP
jgi:hypothetical protein